MRAPLVLLLVAASAAPALAHGGGFANPPAAGGPTAAPGLGDPPTDSNGLRSGPETRWETWWTQNREDLLRLAERADAKKPVVLTPGGAEEPGPPDAATKRSALAGKARATIVPLLLKMLAEDDFDVRASAAIALGKAGDPIALPPLKEAARKDKRPDVRRSALLGLGLLGRTESLVFLGDLAADRAQDCQDRGAALLAIGFVGGDDAAEWLAYFIEKKAWRHDAKKSDEVELLATAYAALGVTGSPEAVLPLARAADDANLDVFFRGHAVLSLGRLRDRGSIQRFVALLSSEELTLRRCAANALGRVVRGTDAAAAASMLAFVQTERDALTRRLLIESLGAVRAKAVEQALLTRLDDGPDADRPYVALALGLQGDPAAARAIRRVVKTERDESGKAACFTALGLLADHDAIPLLESELGRGPQPGIYRGYAALALGVIPSLGSRDVLARKLADEPDPRVRGDYAVALGLLGDDRARTILVDEMKGGGAGGNFAKCTGALCLGTLRCSEAIPDLVDVVESRRVDGIVRALAVVALGQIADSSLVPKLSRLAAGGDSSLATKSLAEALTIL